MPKKKKNGQSPSRGTRQGAEYGRGPESRAHGTTGSIVTQADTSWGYSNYIGSTLPGSGQSASQNRDKVIQGMQDMFSHLDPEVIYMVLSEADFKVENAMDSLLELSNAAEGTYLPPPHVSGFEQAAALLGANHSQTELRSGTGQSFACSNKPASQPEVIPDETHFTEEFDTLLDQELETFTLQASPLMSSIPLSSLPPPSQSIPLSSLPPTSQTHLPAAQTISEFEELNQESNPVCVSVAGGSPVNELSFGGGRIPEQKNISLDFSHLTLDASPGEQRLSAFQVYRRPDQLPTNTQVSAVSRHNEALSTPAMFWNTRAAEFHPRNDGPAFITPVMSNPTPWNMNPISGAQWLAQRPIRQAPLKPSATVPQSWTMPTKKRLKLEGHVLVLLRGAPGSGKTTLAMALVDHNPGGVVLSTDEYFTRNGDYHYNPDLLGEAHEWNQKRAKEAFEKCQTPIIIDNTNMQCWEMKPYIAMAQKYRYRVLFREPDTWWKAKPRELEKRTRHQVSKEKIRRMLDRYERFVSVQSIMNSHKPEPVLSVVDLTQADAGQPQESFPPGISHPDLVGDSGLSKLNPYLSSSLPDVSSVRQMFGTSTGEEEGKMGSFGSKKPMLVCQNAQEGSGTPLSNMLDGEDLDVELDACLVDAGTSKEKFLEQPVAFSESIDQRVKRKRAYATSVQGVNIMDRLVNFDSSDGPLEQEKERECESEPLSDDNVVRPELLEFVGDWPMESQGQRQRRRQSSKNRSVKNVESIAVEEMENVSSDEANQFCTDEFKEAEFQKLRDLLKENSSPASEHSSFLGGKEEDLTLETRSEVPDCVQTFSEGTDPSQDLLSSPIPTKQEEQTEQSDPVSVEDKQEKVEEVELAVSEDKSSMSPNIQGNQCLRGGLESESSLERRRGLNRRSGKSCKLALTFTNQSPSSPPVQSPVISQILPDPTPSLVSCSSASTQTHPQDFALLWRIDQHKCTSEDSTSGALVILEGNSFRFNPKTKEEQSACQQGVPYRVVHEKGSQVEENEFKECHSKQYNLEILTRHFRRVSMDILEDLYEKCHQDMEWTTNLLLDSGEQLYKEDEQVEAELESLPPVDAEKDPSIEKVMGSDVDNARDNQNVDSSKSSPSSISPKSQETNFSDLSQSDDDWSTGKSSQSEADGSDDGVSIKDEKHESSIVDQPTEDTGAYIEVPVANVEEPNKTDPSQIETIVTEGEPVLPCMEGAFEEWSEEDEMEKEKDDEEMRAEVDAITQLLLRQVDEIESKEEEARKEREKERRRTERERREPNTMYFQTLELKLPTELAMQLTELYGPVGVSPGAFSSDDCAVQIDLNLAKLLHQKWKETIQKKHRQAALSYQQLQENTDQWGEPQGSKGLYDDALYMDHWSASCPTVSLRDIMIEEQVMQDSIEKSRSSRKDMDKKDSSAKLKEYQLFSMFPTIDQHFLRDIFRDQNYSLEQTQQFLHALLDDGPVRNVVASEPALQRNGTSRPQSKERKWKQRDVQAEAAQFQDTEDPEYEDFRTEALLHKSRQIESFNKAAEAYRQRRKDVASFYAQQGRKHGDKMREANHLAAMQIFERVNTSLLPQNILDLHGLHVDEAIDHLSKVLDEKTSEWHQGLCGPQLSVITGRGNHSQGGVARIRPAVQEYLKSHHYSYAEPKTGLVLVTLH